jgi:hypothetical protein
LATLTGTQVLLLVAAETGHVYTFATDKLQPMISSEAGMEMIQNCLSAPDDKSSPEAQKPPPMEPTESIEPPEGQHLIPVYNPDTGETHYFYQHNGQAVLLGFQPNESEANDVSDAPNPSALNSLQPSVVSAPGAKRKRGKKKSADDDEYAD